MYIKKIHRKLSIAKNVLFKEGLIAFSIRGLTHIQKNKAEKTSQTEKQHIYTKASKESIVKADFIGKNL